VDFNLAPPLKDLSIIVELLEKRQVFAAYFSSYFVVVPAERKISAQINLLFFTGFDYKILCWDSCPLSRIIKIEEAREQILLLLS